VETLQSRLTGQTTIAGAGWWDEHFTKADLRELKHPAVLIRSPEHPPYGFHQQRLTATEKNADVPFADDALA
jgi:hypothetical protein